MHFKKTLALPFVFLIGFFYSLHHLAVAEGIPPSGTDYYYIENGNMYIHYTTNYKALVSYNPPARMKEGLFYVRKKEENQYHYYVYRNDTSEYAFTYDIPYTVMNLNQPSPFSGTSLDNFILRYGPWNGSSLLGWGSSFKKAEDTYGVNALYLLSHAIHETGWGSSAIARDKNNLFGFKAYDWDAYNSAAPFANFEDSILYVAQYVQTRYLSPSGTYYYGANLKGMNTKYATDERWADKIAGIMARFQEWDCYGCFYADTTGTYVKTMKTNVKISTEQPWHFLPGYMYRRYDDTFVESKREEFAGMVEAPFLALTNEETLYKGKNASTVTFKAVKSSGEASVYREATTSSEMIASLDAKTVFVTRGSQNGMVKVMLQTKEYGWVKATDLQ